MRTARALCSGRRWVEATAPFRQACAEAGAPCWLCDQPIDYSLHRNHRLSFTVDHVVALWTGRNVDPFDPRGWRPAHRSCNSSRGASDGNRLRRPAVDRTSRDW